MVSVKANEPEIVVRIPAEPGWRACLVEKIGDEMKLTLVPVASWGLRSGLHEFGKCVVYREGHGPGTLVPIGGDGAQLDGPAFVGLARPDDTDAAIQERFEQMRRGQGAQRADLELAAREAAQRPKRTVYDAAKDFDPYRALDTFTRRR